MMHTCNVRAPICRRIQPPRITDCHHGKLVTSQLRPPPNEDIGTFQLHPTKHSLMYRSGHNPAKDSPFPGGRKRKDRPTIILPHRCHARAPPDLALVLHHPSRRAPRQSSQSMHTSAYSPHSMHPSAALTRYRQVRSGPGRLQRCTMQCTHLHSARTKVIWHANPELQHWQNRK